MPPDPLLLTAGTSAPKTVRILVYWAGDGALAMLQAIASIVLAMPTTKVSVVIQDPRDRKAAEYAARLRRRGVEAEGVQARLCERPREWYGSFDVILVYGERAVVTADVLRLTLDTPACVVTVYHVKFPDGTLLSISHAVTPSAHHSVRVDAASLAESIEAVSAPGRRVFEGHNAATSAAASLCRAHHARFTADTAKPMVEGFPHERHPHEGAVNAHDPLPLVIVPRPLGPGTPPDLAAQAAQDHPRILEHGRGFELVQIFPAGMTFSDVYVVPGGRTLAVVRTRVVLRADLTGRLCVSD